MTNSKPVSGNLQGIAGCAMEGTAQHARQKNKCLPVQDRIEEEKRQAAFEAEHGVPEWAVHQGCTPAFYKIMCAEDPTFPITGGCPAAAMLSAGLRSPQSASELMSCSLS